MTHIEKNKTHLEPRNRDVVTANRRVHVLENVPGVHGSKAGAVATEAKLCAFRDTRQQRSGGSGIRKMRNVVLPMYCQGYLAVFYPSNVTRGPDIGETVPVARVPGRGRVDRLTCGVGEEGGRAGFRSVVEGVCYHTAIKSPGLVLHVAQARHPIRLRDGREGLTTTACLIFFFNCSIMWRDPFS